MVLDSEPLSKIFTVGLSYWRISKETYYGLPTRRVQTANDPQMKSEIGLGGGLFFETRSFHAWTVDFFCTWIQILSVQKTPEMAVHFMEREPRRSKIPFQHVIEWL